MEINETNVNESFENNNLPEQYIDNTKKPRKNKAKLILSVIGILISLLITVLGYLMVKAGAEVYTRNEYTSGASTVNSEYSYYGGDAYTGIQHAAADASKNAAIAAHNIDKSNNYLNNIYQVICRILGMTGFVVIVLGLMSCCYFGIKCSECSLKSE